MIKDFNGRSQKQNILQKSLALFCFWEYVNAADWNHQLMTCFCLTALTVVNFQGTFNYGDYLGLQKVRFGQSELRILWT